MNFQLRMSCLDLYMYFIL